MRQRSLTLLMAGFLVTGSSAFAATLTGTISDTMCGKDHAAMGNAKPADCTRECVKAGASYALVTSSKVYTLKGDKTQLDKFAGAKVTIDGDISGATVTAKSIKPAQ